MLRDSVLFFREFCSRFETTGSIIPSSRNLARAITLPLSGRGLAPLRVLECGPGTGVFTNEIIGHLKPRDQFDIVELNGSFVRLLQRRLATDGGWQAARDFTTIHLSSSTRIKENSSAAQIQEESCAECSTSPAE